MKFTSKSLLFFGLLASLLINGCATSSSTGRWVKLFDGKTLDGWKASEAPASWRVENGAIVAQGQPKSHLFYVGGEQPFKNFEFQADVMTRSNSNGGIYIHTRFQEGGWPKYGHECQVNNSYFRDPIKTASIYQVVNITNAPALDDKWFKYNIRVEDRRIVITIDGKVIVDYTEPADKKAGTDFTRKLDQGTFAFQAHDDKSIVYYRNIKVRRLP